MGHGFLNRLAALTLALAVVIVPAAAQAGEGQRGRDRKSLSAREGDEGARERRQLPRRTYQEPAFAAGYDNGFKKGLSDGGDGSRYDPVRHADYRDGEAGYRTSYGAREGYRNNFRAGFRQGYEDGYREGARTRN